MILSKEMYCVVCDKCHKAFVNADNQSYFDSEEEASEEAFDIMATKEDGSVDPDYNFVEGEKTGECYCHECAKKLGLLRDE